MKINKKITLIIICTIIIAHSKSFLLALNPENKPMFGSARATNKNQKLNNDALVQAVIDNDIQKVQQLLDAGADVNQIGKPQGAPLYAAVTPLFMAAQYGRTDIAKLLLKAGANINTVSKEGKTPLWIATYYSRIESLDVDDDHTKIIQLLISAGADVNKANRLGDTPLLLAAGIESTDAVQLLIAAGADINKANKRGFTPLYIATQAGYTDIVQLLIAAGANVSTPNRKKANKR